MADLWHCIMTLIQLSLGLSRKRPKFFTFHCIVNGAQAFQGNSDIKSKVETIRLETDIGLALPIVRQRVPHANYISYFFNNNHAIDVLHSAITLPVLNDPSLLLQQVEAILGFPPALGYVKKDPGHLHYRIDSTGFYKDYQRYYQRVFLDHYVPCLELEFKAGSVTDLGVIDLLTQTLEQWLPSLLTNSTGPSRMFLAFSETKPSTPLTLPRPSGKASMWTSVTKAALKDLQSLLWHSMTGKGQSPSVGARTQDHKRNYHAPPQQGHLL